MGDTVPLVHLVQRYLAPGKRNRDPKSCQAANWKWIWQVGYLKRETGTLLVPGPTMLLEALVKGVPEQ